MEVSKTMIQITNSPVLYQGGGFIPAHPRPAAERTGTMASAILRAHNTSGDPERLKIKFDAMASHDITYVGIIQTARASGLTAFPLPYVLTNCHNSLCAVGGTINEDDHVFGLSAAKKYGGEFVPAHQAVIHSYSGAVRRPRTDDLGLRLPYPLRCLRYRSHRRGRP